MIYNVPDLNPYFWQSYFLCKITRFNVLCAPRQVGKTEILCEVINTVCHAPLISKPVVNLCSDQASNIYKLYKDKLNELFDNLDGWKYDNSRITDSIVRRSDGNAATINFIGAEAKPTGCTGTSPNLNVIDEAGKVKMPFIFQSALPSTNFTEGINIITGTWTENMEYYYNHALKKMNQGDPNWFAMRFDFEDPWVKHALTESQIKGIKSIYDLEDEDQALLWNTEMMMKSGEKLTRYPYREAMEKGHVQMYPLNKGYPVNLAWDDGRGTTAIWAFQFINGHIYLIDYVEFKKSDLVTIAKNRYKWYKDNQFKFGVQVLPHTMKERDWSVYKGASRVAILRREFYNNGVYLEIPRVDSISTKLIAGIQLFNYCIFHPRTLKGRQVLSKYSRKAVKNEAGVKVYEDKIDSRSVYSHGGDAFGEIAMGFSTGLFQSAYNSLISLPSLPYIHHPRLLYPY